MPDLHPVHLMQWIEQNREFFQPHIETQLTGLIQSFNANEALRTCRPCGAILRVPAGA